MVLKHDLYAKRVLLKSVAMKASGYIQQDMSQENTMMKICASLTVDMT